MTDRELADDEVEDRLVAALRERKGDVTESDLVVATGLPPHQVAVALRRLLLLYRSHVAVTQDGQILYRFDPALVRRSARPGAFVRAVARAAWRVFQTGFKVLTGFVLLVYVVTFVVMLMLISRGGVFSIDGSWIRSLRKAQRWQRAKRCLAGWLARGVSASRKVFAFIFGPAAVAVDELADERELLAYVRARRGIIAPAEIVAQTGWTSQVADQESTRLVARYGGDVDIEDGHGLFRFPELLATSAEPARLACPKPCWERRERPVALTGNTVGEDVTVAIVNAWVLLAATVLTPFVFAERLAIDLAAPLAGWGLIYVPAGYALAAFLIYGIRRKWVAGPENRRRLMRNLRRLVLRAAFEGRDVSYRAVLAQVAGFPAVATPQLVEQIAREVGLELDAEITADKTGRLHFRWSRLQATLAAAEVRRRRLPPSSAAPIVFSSDEPGP